ISRALEKHRHAPRCAARAALDLESAESLKTGNHQQPRKLGKRVGNLPQLFQNLIQPSETKRNYSWHTDCSKGFSANSFPHELQQRGP
ncbi:hypothetical protein, partial [Pseudomonas japonica]|uniref:hypothetical protein n=1 Tax=Pseudomonas japonica TaxID=256466 RepID=UPI001C3F1E37